MRIFLKPLLLISTLVAAQLSMVGAAQASAPAPVKDWTFLVYINGNNNLDEFGALNINQMETVGSTDKVNVLVEWASLARKSVQRLYVKKDNDTAKVTSPVVQTLGNIDMGDYRSVIEFVRWGAQNYPAKHYFVDIWNHGSGWHKKLMVSGQFKIEGISYDDLSGNHITTEQLGTAISESAKILGQKIDIYASDACLMAMAEVATEMAASVNVYGGSQETEPADGWPYDVLLTKWNALPAATASDLGAILTNAYVDAYASGALQGTNATFAAYDMTKLDAFNASIKAFGAELSSLNTAGRAKIVAAAQANLTFTYDDYGDVGNFLSLVDASRGSDLTISDKAISDVKNSLKDFVIANRDTSNYTKATGVSIWLPNSKSTYDTYASQYQDLKFNAGTGWGNTMRYLLQDSSK